MALHGAAKRESADADCWTLCPSLQVPRVHGVITSVLLGRHVDDIYILLAAEMVAEAYDFLAS